MPSRARGERERPERSVPWTNVHRFRLRQQFLAPRARARATLRVLGAIGGAQAQMPSAAELSLAARVDGLTRPAVAAAAGSRRAIVRMWCMRRTLFWLPAGDVALFARGTQRRADKEVRWARNHGISAAELDRVFAALDASLLRPKTRLQFCGEVAAALGRPLAARRGDGWGGDRPVPAVKVGRWNVPGFYLLHLYATRRPVCVGPSDGAQATYVRADAWVRHYRELPVAAAEEALLRRYLSGFGPATPTDFARWSGIGRTAAAEIWERIAPDTVTVDVEGWTAGLLRGDLRWLEEPDALAEGTVRLLPHFDTYLLGHDERRHLVDRAHHRRIYRTQGWIAPTLLVDGRVAATWSSEVLGGQLRVRLAPFRALGARPIDLARVEAERLARYLGLSGAVVRAAGR